MKVAQFLFLILTCALILSFIGNEQSDILHFEIKEVRDKEGLLDKYETYIRTPVCEDDKCYLVEIMFYWDVMGRYVGYDTIPGQQLTKLDHIPFTHEDYQKLGRLLNDGASPIGNYSKEELTKDSRESEIDGFSGATIQEIKEQVISGGVYSCHTLWHIAHKGEIIDSLKSRTKALLTKPLVKKLVKLDDQDVNYFLINSFKDEEFDLYMPEVFLMMKHAKGYFVKNTVEAMPSNVIQDSLSQTYFASEFKELNYFSQVALLKKLKPDILITEMKNVLKDALSDNNSIKNELIKKLIK
ncbi:hypothetical protein [Flagellimonas myxillae]|uniref:hypothetical protein n=1 Tax=Flagellimonas myxillae TaxID=2942214 RepID=UPI00201EE85E|nr:hypothetical protein [Muricauda myxillae]MCL6267870.1 hypothetical protein [Muricauda myxillae]